MTARPRYQDLEDQDPFPFYEELLADGRAVWDDGMNAWLVPDHERCAGILRDEDRFEHPGKTFRGAVEVKGGRRALFLLQGEEHEIMYRYIGGLISGRRARGYQKTLIRPAADQLIGHFRARGSAELASEYADRLPPNVIATLLGLPLSDEETLARLRDLNEDVARWNESQGSDPDVLEPALRGAAEIKDILRPIVRRRLRDPGDDLISELWRTGPTVLGDWSEEDTLTQSVSLLFGGSKTTAHLLSNAVYLLLTDPALRDRVAGDPERLAPKLVEETLRLLGVIHWRSRVAASDVDLGDVVVRAGERVCPLTGAAGRDADRYQDPHRIDLGRRPAKDHLAFGAGPRFCPGAALGRAVAAEAIAALLTALPGIALDEAADPPRMVAFAIRSFRPLHTRFDVA